MGWLVAFVLIILAVIFWRISLPLLIIAVVGVGLIFLYIQGEDARVARKQKIEERAVRERFANAKATVGKVARKWEVLFYTDPASGKRVPRSTNIRSDEGLCLLQIEKRINRTRLASIYCKNLKISTYGGIEVKFDNRSTSDTMKIAKFSSGNNVYIYSDQGSYSSHLSYNEFLRRMTGAKKIALRLTVMGAGKHWIRFSLTGSGPALTRIGAFRSKPKK
jgi:hypothetical protein